MSRAPHWQTDPAIGYDGTNFLVAWVDGRLNYLIDIYGTRVSPGGTVLDTAGIAICTTGCELNHPDIGSDGVNFLVVFEDYFPDSLSFRGIRGARVAPGGTVLDTAGFTISGRTFEQRYPAVIFDGTNYEVVWQDYRDGYFSHLYGARVTTAGNVSDSFAVVRQASNQLAPAFALETGCPLLLVYQGWVGTYEGRTYNSYRIWGKLTALGAAGEARIVPGSVISARPSIVRSVLNLDAQTDALTQPFLLDITGRRVLHLHAGPNDVRQLSPGVHFVSAVPSPTKVVIQR